MSDLLNSASLVMIPSGYKEDVVYSQIPTDGSGDLSFTRASNGTRVNSAGLVEVCPWNLIPNSEVFALWNKVEISNTITVTDNFVTAPNGTLTAAKVVFATFDGTGQIFQNYTVDPTQNFTATLYAKVPSGTKQCWFGFFDGSIKTELKTLTTEWQRIEYTGSITAGGVRACWFYGEGSASNVEVHLWGGQLNVGTAKPYFPTTDRLNVPRLTYQNGGGGCPSLLLEKQSTNLATYSEQFDNAGWVKYQGGTITANSVTSPDGTQNADTLNVASGQTFSGIYQSVSGSSDVYTISIFAKYNTKRWMFIFDASASAQGWFDLQNGVVGTITSGYTGTIQNFGNGWYRCTFKKNTAVTPAFFQIGLVDADGESTPTSNGSSYIWGAQCEQSTYVTSYIPTTSSSATRVADACSKTGISSLIGQTEGVVFLDVVINGQSNLTQPINIYNNNFSAQTISTIAITYSNGDVGAYAFKGNGTFDNIACTATGYNIGERLKIAYRYKSGDFALYINGVQKATSNSTLTFVGTKSELYLGAETVYYAYKDSIKLNEFVQFPTALTNAELQALTA